MSARITRAKPSSKEVTETKATRHRLEEQRVAELLDIAASVFISDGFAAASTNEIARRSNSSKTTFYSRFPSKEKLFVAVIEHRLNKVFSEVSSSLPTKPPLHETLLNFGLRLLNVALSKKQVSLLRVIAMEADRFPELGQRFLELGPKRGLAVLAEYFASQIRQRRIEQQDPKQMAEHFLNLLIGGSVLWYLLGLESTLPSRSQREVHVEAAIQMFLRVYGNRRSKAEVAQ